MEIVEPEKEMVALVVLEPSKIWAMENEIP
jgi:hypothetical protein